MPNIQELKHDSLQLNESERAQLALALIQSLDGKPEEGVQAAWDKEIEKRVAEIKAGEVQGRSAEEVFAEIRSRYD